MQPQRLMKEVHLMNVFVCTTRAFVDQQQFIFDMLWHKAVPAKQRIKEIEQGLKGEFIETIKTLTRHKFLVIY